MAFESALPPQAKLVLGLTPIPESFAPPGYSARWQVLPNQWSQRMKADALLTNLPPVMPDLDFANTTHLNERGASDYTEILARCLEPHLAR